MERKCNKGLIFRVYFHRRDTSMLWDQMWTHPHRLKPSKRENPPPRSEDYFRIKTNRKNCFKKDATWCLFTEKQGCPLCSSFLWVLHTHPLCNPTDTCCQICLLCAKCAEKKCKKCPPWFFFPFLPCIAWISLHWSVRAADRLSTYSHSYRCADERMIVFRSSSAADLPSLCSHSRNMALMRPTEDHPVPAGSHHKEGMGGGGVWEGLLGASPAQIRTISLLFEGHFDWRWCFPRLQGDIL